MRGIRRAKTGSHSEASHRITWAVQGRQAVASTKANADRFATNVAPIIRDIEGSGITSRRAIARALNARGVATARGGRWTEVQVGSILQRA